jgi:polygalacturonase
MLILGNRPQRRESSSRFRSKLIWGAVWMVPPLWVGTTALADPATPIIGSTVYNAAVSNLSIDNGLTVTAGGSVNNASVIDAFINFAAKNGGGTVEIPASNSVYSSNEIVLRNDINLQIDSGATIQNLTPSNPLLVTSGLEHDVELSGGGTLNDNATVNSSDEMVSLSSITRLEINDVTIENASLQHLEILGDNNATINDITIKDPNGYLANTDGIDFSGSNFLIENCNVADGDDDIVAKPQGTFTTNITIANCTIGNGHGISIGGQTNAGLSNMTVTNCTFNGTTYGIRLKAGRLNGGLVQNVTYSNITMTGVQYPLYISSWYDGGNDTEPTLGDGAAGATTANFTAGQTPQWNNITFNNISTTDTAPGNHGPIIYGLSEAPVTDLFFNNVSFFSKSYMEVNYAGFNGTWNPNAPPNPNYEILFQNSSLDGIALTPASFSNSTLFAQTPGAQYETVMVVPEPTSAALMGAGIALVAKRRRNPGEKT